MKQWLKEVVHNCVVHPALPFLSAKLANLVHDKNANWAFGLNRYDEVGLEDELKSPFSKEQIAQLLKENDALFNSEEFKQWQAYFNLTHYDGKKKPVADSQQQTENLLTGRKMLAFIEEVLQKTPASQHPNYPKDSDSNSTPTP